MDNRSDGQHRDDGTPAINNGQRTRHLPDVDCGQLSGGQEHGGSRVHRGGASADVSTAVDVHGRPIHHGREGATRKE